MLSAERLEPIIERFNLYPDLRGADAPAAAVERMRRDIELELRWLDPPAGANRTIRTIGLAISFRGQDPQTVARVANALAGVYAEQSRKSREAQERGEIELLARQLQELRRRLADQEAKLSDFNRLHMGELPEHVSLNLATLERLNAQLTRNVDSQLRAAERRAVVARQLANLEAPSIGAVGGGPPPRRPCGYARNWRRCGDDTPTSTLTSSS